MEDQVLSERDTNWIATIFSMSSTISTSIDVLCGALELTVGEREEISRRVYMDRSTSSYTYFSLAINKWIEKNSGGATVKRLAMVLRQLGFNSTADELLKTLGDVPIHYPQNNTARIVKNPERVDPSHVQASQLSVSVKSMEEGNTTTTTLMSDQFKKVKLEDSQQGEFSGSKKFLNLCGSQTDLNEFLQNKLQSFNTIRSIKFDNIVMSWSRFWNAAEQIKCLESIQLTNLNLSGFSIPSRKKLMPNLRKYVISLGSPDSEDSLRHLQRALQPNEISDEKKCILEALIPFVNNNSDEEVWTTCFRIGLIVLQLVIQFKRVVVIIDTDNLEFVVDRCCVVQIHDSTQLPSSLPNFLQAFERLKKLWVTNQCEIEIKDRLNSFSIPSSLTHLFVTEVPTSIRRGEFNVALKSCKELIFLNVRYSDSEFDINKHILDIACLSPAIRYLILTNAHIICSTDCEFEHLSSLILFDSSFQSSVNFPFMCNSIKKCYFHSSHSTRLYWHPSSELKNWLEMDSLEVIVVKGVQINKYDEVEEILLNYGVPRNAENFALEKQIEGQWKLVRRVGSGFQSLTQVLKEGWMDNGK